MFKVPKRNLIIDCLGVRIGEQRGGERFMCGIIAELGSTQNTDFLLVINESCLEFVKGLIPPSQYLLVPISGKNRVYRMLVQMIAGPVIARLSGAALYTSSSVFPTLGFPCPTSAILHDLLLYSFPKEFNRATWIGRTALLKASLATLSAVFTSSHASAEDIKARFKKHARSVHVVPGGASQTVAPRVGREREVAILNQLALKDRKFVLSVLGGGRFKNQRGLAEAADKLLQRGRDDIEVIVVGDALRVFKTMQYGRCLRALGFVSDEVLTVLYANAQALICPTFFEGFGLPIIEAQAAGLPVICSDIPVLREVAGQSAVFVDPRSAESIAEGMITVLDSPQLRQRLIKLGKENAALFTWQRTTEQFLAACRAVIGPVGVEQSLTTSV